MYQRTVTVGSPSGLHVRPANLIADAAAEFENEVSLNLAGEADDDAVDAASSLMIMSLAAEMGDEVIVSGEDATQVDAIAELVAANLDA